MQPIQKIVLTLGLALTAAFIICPSSRIIAAELDPSAISSQRFGRVTYGRVQTYHEQDCQLRHDLSGAAFHDGLIITVDDGGQPSDYPFVHVMRTLPDDHPVRLPVAADQKDLEGATWSRGYYVTTTSMSLFDKSGISLFNQHDFADISRFSIDLVAKQRTKVSQIPLRSRLLAGLQQHFANDTWFQRIDGQQPRKGGLNVEAITRTADEQGQETLLLGLRSPLFGNHFGHPEMDSSLSLKEGAAIVAIISDPFGTKPSITFTTVDLNGAGIRAMEWIPALNGYVIVSGPVMRKGSFNLWFWPHTDGPAEPLFLPGFQHLCRPEAVIPFMEDTTPYLVILSESSGLECSKTMFSYVKAKILLSTIPHTEEGK